MPANDLPDPVTIGRRLRGSLRTLRVQRCRRLGLLARSDAPAYRFRRASEHHPTCRCLFCGTLQIFRSNAMRDVMGLPTRRNLRWSGESFISAYSRGDFLDAHCDAAKGSVAFAWSATPRWRREFGGNLHLFRDDRLTVERIVVPEFDRLVCLDIDTVQQPHAVSRVETTHRRLSVTGWYSA